MIYLSMEGKPVSSMYPWPPKHSKPYKGTGTRVKFNKEN